MALKTADLIGESTRVAIDLTSQFMALPFSIVGQVLSAARGN
jgi:hypothetical protein